jgi:CheY-like chemotaxis protein
MTSPETHSDGMRGGRPGPQAAGQRSGDDPLFRAALETMLDSVVMTTAVRGDDGRIVDFVIDYLNPVAEIGQRPAEQIVGRRFQIRADERLATMPVVIMTSSTEERDIVQAYHLRANSYVSKPVDFELFQQAVGDVGRYWMVLNKSPGR